MIVSYDNKALLRTADKTGAYVNRRTKHRAWYPAGATLPPGYEPVDDQQQQAGEAKRGRRRRAAKDDDEA